MISPRIEDFDREYAEFHHPSFKLTLNYLKFIEVINQLCHFMEIRLRIIIEHLSWICCA